MEKRDAIARVINEPVVVTVGSGSRVRTMRLVEPPMYKLLKVISSSIERLKETIRANPSFFVRLAESGAEDLQLTDSSMLMPLFEVVCEVVEAMDESEGEPEHRFVDIVTSEQFLGMVPDVVDVVNVKAVWENFSKALAVAGIEVQVTREEETSEETKETTASCESPTQ